MKKIILTALALGVLAGGVGFSNNQEPLLAQASSTHVVYNRQLTTAPTNRNVTFTGQNALYSKAGILPGAKKIVSQTGLIKLTQVTDVIFGVRAYRVAKINNGNIYYKIVTFDGKYRGWIYGGKSSLNFAGGIKKYTTTTPIATPNPNQKFKISNADVEKQNDVIWNAPQGTEYKVGLDSKITDISQYKDTVFTVQRAVRTTRYKEDWYQIASNNSELNNKWISVDDANPIK
ncbi:MAG: GW dipeptide domain-containing protein [Leuconostoc mesenteroides]